MKKTVVLGASPNEERYSNMCVKLLQKNNHPVIPVGIKEGKIDEVEIIKGKPAEKGVHTVAVYLAPENQESYYDYVIGLNPERIIFTPGSENPEFQTKARAYGIETMDACPLVMMNTGQY
ncbi:MAG: CoA-binding protein [Marinifilaceae bacterium]|jgi:predicted CoA-binding protein